MWSRKTSGRALCAALVISALAACSQKGGKGEGGAPAAKVNGSVITRTQVARAAQSMVAQQQGVGKAPAPEAMRKTTQLALNQLTSAELLYQAACKVPIKDLDKLVAQKYEQNRKRFPNEEQYQKALKGLAMTPQEVEEAMRKEIVVNTFIAREIAPKVTVSEAEARKFYDDNLEKLFKKGEQLRASHILVSVPQDAPPAEKLKARAKAEALLKRVRSGEDFGQLAAKESTCPSRARAGELGLFGRGEMMPQFDKAAFALKPGETSGVVETVYGYHIIKLIERLPPSTAQFSAVKGKIMQYLGTQKVRQAVATYVAKLSANANIELVN
jgi:peptidyl-prolyl cis-trans isomerase C